MRALLLLLRSVNNHHGRSGRRWLSSSSSSSGIKREYPWATNEPKKSSTQQQQQQQQGDTNNTIMANVVQGPSMMLTTLDRPSPTMMHLPGLRSLPVWTSYDGNGTNKVAYQDPTVTRIVNHLQQHAPDMEQEYRNVAPTLASDYDVNGRGGEHADDALHHGGTWDWHSFLLQGKPQAAFSVNFPHTTSILQELSEDLFTDTPFGFGFFSNLAGGSTIDAHSSPINFRLRIHVPLIVPKSSSDDVGIRVGPMTQSWVRHQALVLDDSYNHEVWNRTNEERVVLLVDIWHPDVRPTERTEIRRMFQHAAQQGWIRSNK